MATNVAGAAGGGIVAGATGGGGGDVMAQLAELAKTIDALAAALGGASMLGTTTGGGASVVQQGDPTQGDPSQVDGAQGDPAQGDPTQAGHEHGDPAQGDPAQGDPAQTGHAHGNGEGEGHDKAKGKGHGKHGDVQVIKHDGPVDKAKAKEVLASTTEFFSKLTRADVTMNKPGGTHAKLTDKMRKEFEAKFPGVEAPKAVVFQKGTETAIGVVYNEQLNGDFDLGMGSSHRHKAGAARMQHVWFTGADRLGLAFSDTTKKDKVKELLANGAGASGAADASAGANETKDKDKKDKADKKDDKDKGKAKGKNKS